MPPKMTPQGSDAPKRKRVVVEEPETQAEVDAETKKRRQTRKAQNELLEDIAAKKGQLEDFESGVYDEFRARNNAIFKEVGHSREGGADGHIHTELLDAVLKRADKLDDLSRRIHFDDLALNLTKAFRVDGEFCWRSLGQDVGKLFIRPTPLTTMLGSMDKPEKIKALHQRKQHQPKERLEEVRPEEIIQNKSKAGGARGEAEEEVGEATFSRITNQNQKLVDMTEDGHIDLLKMLVDEKNHVQTVENFFDFAFLIKDKKVQVHEDSESKQPRVRHFENNRTISTGEARQVVLSLNMKDVKRLAAALSKQGNVCPLHRNDDLYDAANAARQSEILQERTNAKVQYSQVVKAADRELKSQKSQAAKPSQHKR